MQALFFYGATKFRQGFFIKNSSLLRIFAEADESPLGCSSKLH